MKSLKSILKEVSQNDITPEKIHQAAEKARYKQSSVAFIWDTYARYKKLFPLDLVVGPVQSFSMFQQLLLKWHKEGKIRLSTADMPQALDQQKLKMSKTGEFVFVRIPRLAGWGD